MRVMLAIAVVVLLLALLAAPLLAVAGLAETATPTATPHPTATPTAPPTAIPRLAVTAKALHVRACAGVDCAIVGVLVRGDVVEALGGVEHTPDGATWRHVRARGGLTGWANAKYLTWRAEDEHR